MAWKALFNFDLQLNDTCLYREKGKDHFHSIWQLENGKGETKYIERVCRDILRRAMDHPEKLKGLLKDVNDIEDPFAKDTIIKSIEGEKKVIDADFRGYAEHAKDHFENIGWHYSELQRMPIGEEDPESKNEIKDHIVFITFLYLTDEKIIKNGVKRFIEKGEHLPDLNYSIINAAHSIYGSKTPEKATKNGMAYFGNRIENGHKVNKAGKMKAVEARTKFVYTVENLLKKIDVDVSA